MKIFYINKIDLFISIISLIILDIAYLQTNWHLAFIAFIISNIRINYERSNH